MKYRSEIDGLRAVAVLPVIFFHAGTPGFEAGFLGVDIFFVISGFLITTIIVAELEEGSFSLSRFYERRARRILPALTVMILACIPFAWQWMLPIELTDFGKSVAATSLFVSNVLYWRQTDYFSADAEMNPLLHTWSLAVEEQFYILFPLVLMLMWPRARRWVPFLLVIGVAMSLLLAELLAERSRIAVFFLAPTRAFELLAGSIAALYVRRFGERPSNVASAVGLAGIAGGFLWLADKTLTPGIWSLIPVVGTALILVYGRRGTIVATLLSARPLIWTGLISYSLYLWHQPVFAFAQIRMVRPASGWLLAGLILIIFALSWLSWRYVERPFRARNGVFTGTGRMLSISAATIAVVALFGTALIAGRGIDGRLSPSGVRFADLNSLEAALAPNYGLDPACDSANPRFGAPCQHGDTPDMFLWGDSFAMHLAQALVASPSGASFVQATLSQCGPMPGLATMGSITSWRSCIAFNDAVLRHIIQDDSIDLVVISSPFRQVSSEIFRRDGTSITDRIEAGRILRASLLNLQSELAIAGKDLVIVTPPALSGVNLGTCFLRRQAMGLSDQACDFSLEQALTFNAASQELLASVADQIPVVSLDKLTCQNGACRSSSPIGSLYRDRMHLSIEGSTWLGKRFDLAALVRMAASK